jgi:hypothetical protein
MSQQEAALANNQPRTLDKNITEKIMKNQKIPKAKIGTLCWGVASAFVFYP